MSQGSCEDQGVTCQWSGPGPGPEPRAPASSRAASRPRSPASWGLSSASPSAHLRLPLSVGVSALTHLSPDGMLASDEGPWEGTGGGATPPISSSPAPAGARQGSPLADWETEAWNLERVLVCLSQKAAGELIREEPKASICRVPGTTDPAQLPPQPPSTCPGPP